MILKRIDPPGFLEDLTDAQKTAWSNRISADLDREIARNTGNHFYNPTKVDTGTDATEKAITWNAFPGRLQNVPEPERWKRADSSRGQQDEYCEWSVTRDSKGKITRVTFTCEGPEYWEFLANVNLSKVVELYKEFVSPKVKKEDLFPGGSYGRNNQWNNSTTQGAMHLVMKANTLEAEINLGVSASIVRKIDGRILTDDQELIQCGQYGVAERHSDPTIGGGINELARMKADLTIANPVALYMDGLSTEGWTTPDGSDPAQYWKVVRPTVRRGTKYILRAVYEVPKRKDFTVGDIKINQRPIQYGAQIADFITMKVIGLACRFDQNQTAPVTRCVGSFQVAMAAPHAATPTTIEEPSHSGKASRR